jgi:hypothetical protein
VLSIAFETLELALQFVIPDFQECWWDSLLLDLLGANMLGMCLGRVTLWLLESKEYDWSGRRGMKMGYFRLALNQFTPFSWEQYHWEVFSSFKRFGEIVFAMVLCLITELNAFFMLTTLSIPKESNFNSYRLLLVFLIGIPAAAEVSVFVVFFILARLVSNGIMLPLVAVLRVHHEPRMLAAGAELVDDLVRRRLRDPRVGQVLGQRCAVHAAAATPGHVPHPGVRGHVLGLDAALLPERAESTDVSTRTRARDRLGLPRRAFLAVVHAASVPHVAVGLLDADRSLRCGAGPAMKILSALEIDRQLGRADEIEIWVPRWS